MTYREFIWVMLESMEQEFGDGYTIHAVDITKNNGTVFTGIAVLKDGESSGPVLYMEHLYERYEAGGSLKELAQELFRAYEKNAHMPVSEKELKSAQKWENVKERLEIRLVNYERNKERLTELVHRRYLDFAVLYYVNLDGDNHEQYSFCITRVLLERWNVSAEELERTARQNQREQNATVIRSIYDVLGGGTAMKDQDKRSDIPTIYVLSNRQGLFGASAVLDQETLEQFVAEKHTDLLLLPASVHEMLLLMEEMPYEIGELQSMVESINASCVAAEEVLSSHVYRYSAKTKELSIADECGTES